MSANTTNTCLCADMTPEQALAAGLAKLIPLTRGKFTYVHTEDYERTLAEAPWFYSPSGGGYDYAGRSSNRRLVSLHRRLLGVTDSKVHVDHINGDGLDNRKCNLRVATAKENSANRGATRANTSGYKGVSRHRDRWRAQVKVRGTGRLYSAVFGTAEEAARAFDGAIRLYRPGPFERFNFPLPGERDLNGNLVPLDTSAN